jgi:hypothetical protein
VTDDDLCAVIDKLVEMAKEGNLAAIRELLDRTLGRPLAAVAGGTVGEESRSLRPAMEFTPVQRQGFIETNMRRAYGPSGKHEPWS